MDPILDELRVRWWSIAVGIMWIALPLVCVTAWMIAPIFVLLDGESEGMSESQIMKFSVTARYQGCGDYIIILLAFFQLRTENAEVFAMTVFCLFLWSIGSNIIAWATAVSYGEQIDPLAFTIIDLIDFLLQGYMFLKIRQKLSESAGGGESSPLVE